MSNLKMLITGHSGLIGKELIRVFGETEVFPINIIKNNAVWPDIDKETHIILIHLAWKSIPSLNNAECSSLAENDFLMTKSIFNEFSKLVNPKSIIFASTAGDIYKRDIAGLCNEQSIARPSSPYSFYKLKAEKEACRLSMNSVSLRISNTWGSSINKMRRNGLIDKSIFNTKYNNDAHMTISISKESVLSIIHIKDLCEAIHQLCMHLHTIESNRTSQHYKKVFNLSAENLPVSQITETLRASIHSKFKFSPSREKPFYTMVDARNFGNEFKWRPQIFFNEASVREIFDGYD